MNQTVMHTLSLLHSHRHKHIDIFPFALWARQQLRLVQVEEQLMNQTELLTIHICWHSPAAASRLAFAGLPRPRPTARVNTWEGHHRLTRLLCICMCIHTTNPHRQIYSTYSWKYTSMLSAIPKSLSFLFWNNWGCRHLMRRQKRTESIWPQLT